MAYNEIILPVTVIIPTKNRPEFLIRILKYYNQTSFQGWIQIGDSSDPYNVGLTRKIVNQLAGSLKIIYQEYPQLSSIETVRQLIAQVTTPYVAVLPDDDFLTTAGLTRCTKYLDQNLGYAGAHGMGTLFTLSSSGAYGKFEGCSYYRQAALEDERSAQRLFKYLSDYSAVLFSVFRTEVLSASLTDCAHLKNTWDRAILEELLPGCIAVSSGKVKQLDGLYLIRQSHNQRYVMSKPYEWITGPSWQPCYQFFCDTLTNILAQNDDIKTEEAREVIYKGFMIYLRISLNKGTTLNTSSLFLGYLKQIVRTIPGMKRVWRRIQGFLPNRHNQLSLLSMLRRTSNYYTDFMPIYNLVSNVSKDTYSL